MSATKTPAAPPRPLPPSPPQLEAEGRAAGVIVRLPLDLGSLEFTPRQARGFASSLMKAARDADDILRIQARKPVHLAAHSTPAPAPPDLGNEHSPDEELSHDSNGKA